MAARKPPTLPPRAAASGDWKLVRATFVSGKGLSLSGGFVQPIVKLGEQGVSSLTRDDSSGMLVVERTWSGEEHRLEIPLSAVALEWVRA